MCDMTHSYVWHDSFIHMCDMAHSYVWHDSFICVNDSFICVAWLIHTCDMSHSYVLQHSFMCAMTQSNVWHDSFIRVTWLNHTCDMTAWASCNCSGIKKKKTEWQRQAARTNRVLYFRFFLAACLCVTWRIDIEIYSFICVACVLHDAMILRFNFTKY